MKLYLVDYENVNTHGLDGISDLSSEDHVVIFYSDNANNMTFDLHMILNECKAAVSYFKVEVGHKDALDFQLASYMGYCIRDNRFKDIEYFIVSEDQGFTSVQKFWEARDTKIELLSCIAAQISDGVRNELAEKVAGVIEEPAEAVSVADLILRCSSKLELNNALMKNFPSMNNLKSGKIYKAVKPLLQY